MRLLRTMLVARGLPLLKPLTSSIAHSIACSPEGHSRAWWTPEVRERRLAIVAVDVLGDLDAEDVLAQPRLVRQRDQADEVGVLRGELLELRVVVGQRAVGVAAAREGGARGPWRRSDGRRRGRPCPACRGRGRARASGSRPCAAPARRRAPCRTTPRVSLPPCSVMSRPSFISSCLRARVGVMTLTSCGGLAFASSIAAGRTAANCERRGHGGGVAGAAAGLQVERAAGGVAEGDLLRVGRRVGGQRAAVGVEHRDVPVALGRRAAYRDRAGSGHADAAASRRRPPGPVRAVAGGLVRARRGGQRAVEDRLGRAWRRARSCCRRAARRASAGRRRRHEGEGSWVCERARASRSGGDWPWSCDPRRCAASATA